jgi:heme-degrading monooxygenase HmoA
VAQHDTSAFVVVDIWRVRPGKQADVERELREAGRHFRQQPGILSVDFTHLDGDPARYLVVFRYTNADAREAFVASQELRATLQLLSALWDRESPVYMGLPSGF